MQRKVLRPAAAPAPDAAGVAPVLSPSSFPGSIANAPVDESQGVGAGFPVDYSSDIAAWRSPQYLTGAPHRLPAPVVRTPLPLIGLQPAAGDVDAAASASVAAPASTPISDPHHYAQVSSNLIPVTQNATQTPFLTQPSGRRNLLGLRNPAAAGNIYIDFGQSASAGSWLQVGPGIQILFDEVVPQDDLYCFADTPGLTLAFAYSNLPA